MNKGLSLPFWMLFSYLLGSIPTGFCLGKLLKGIDVREVGSGNPGATNVFREVGKTAGLLTLAIDMMKGFLPVKMASLYLTQSQWQLALIGLSAIAGHNWTMFLRFRGGKGVATSAGVFLALLPVPTFIALGVFIIALFLTHHVSIGSMAGAISLFLSTWIIVHSRFLTLFTGFCAFLILVLHKKNISRLIHGEEPKLPLQGIMRR